MDRAFCARDRKRRTRVCFPGAGIGHVAERLDRVLSGEGTNPVVCLSVGGNDIGKVRSEELFKRYREALGKIRDRGGIPIVCGVLPRRGVGREWLSRAIAINCRLEKHCANNGWAFIDDGQRFYGNDYLYCRDGVHLSREGVKTLSASLEREIVTPKGGFRQ